MYPAQWAVCSTHDTVMLSLHESYVKRLHHSNAALCSG
jgi:hypothetical protein